MRRLSRMRQVMARAEHARGIPPPPGFVFDEQKQVYVEASSAPDASLTEGR
jgi:hypothetical protein